MKKENKLYKILKKVKFFSSLDSNSLSIIENKIKIKSYKKGEYICREGEPSDKMYIILSGAVRVLKKGKGNSQIDITKLKSGSIAGIMSLFEKKKRSATLIAVGNVKVGELEYNIFQGLIDKYPAISKALIIYLSNYIRK
jgi:CRP-like cAMP-binding protein